MLLRPHTSLTSIRFNQESRTSVVKCVGGPGAGQPTATSGLATLSAWVIKHGGNVNQNLRLEDKAPCGVRGIVAAPPGISLTDLDQGPLISLPYSLYFDASKAQALLAAALTQASPAAGPGPLPDADALAYVQSSLSAVQALGLALALERRLGLASAWRTYIASLPPVPPCPWLLPEQGSGAVAEAVAEALRGNTGLSTVAQAAVAAAAAATVEAVNDCPQQQQQQLAVGALEASPPQAATTWAAAAAAAAARGVGERQDGGLGLRADAALATNGPACADGLLTPASAAAAAAAATAAPAAAAAAAMVATDGVHAAAAAAAWALAHPPAATPAPAAAAAAAAVPPLPPPLEDLHLPSYSPHQEQPPAPSCPPLLPQPQQERVQAHPAPHPQQKAWEAAVHAARAQHMASCQQVLDVCGVQLGISMADMQWGLGQVISRALTSGDACGLLPVIDLLNHNPEARPPMLQLDDNDQLVMTVTSLRNNEVVPLGPGQELCINYTGGGALTPLESFLKFGFVPEEAWGLVGDSPKGPER